MSKSIVEIHSRHFSIGCLLSELFRRSGYRSQLLKSHAVLLRNYHALAAIPQYFVPLSQIDPTPSNHPQDFSDTIPTQLSKCTGLSQVYQIHAHIIRTHYLEFRNVPFYWNNLIRSYTRWNAPSKAVRIYLAMSRAGIAPDCYTFPIALKAVCQFCPIQSAKQLHAVSIRHGLEGNEFCVSGLISMYAKACEFDSARKVFEENGDRKLGSWNAIIGGFSQGGRFRDVISMFIRMKRSGFEPDDVTVVSVTSACAGLGDLSLALQLHKCVFQAKSVAREEILMLNSLVDMYGKCGRMDLAHKVFSMMDEHNVSSWTSMVVGHAIHGHVEEALKCFNSMREASVVPNHVTFIGVLSACVHGGLVREGKYYFHMMKHEYGIEPQVQHYGCMVDLLGRAGLLEEARSMVEKKMPMRANVVVWGSLMGACEMYNDVGMAEWVAQHLIELEPWNDGVYVVLSNIYASRNMWEKVEFIRELLKERRLQARVSAYSTSTSAGGAG